ncbi:MAG: twin-arginine translocase subunit TatC [Alistipes sp.]|jgi:sec-independent protein translocase protein TatC|nr:twin-arginine translocase subunit TatC [Alistipes sp.]
MSSDKEMTFFEHLEDLRPHLMRAIAALFIIAIVAFCFNRLIIDELLFGPQSPDFPTNRWLCEMGVWLDGLVGRLGDMFGAEWSIDPEVLCLNQGAYTMVNNKVVGQFNLHLKMSMAAALVLGIPYFLWEIWQFVKPALTDRERAGTRLFVFYVSLCFFAGVLFGYYIVTPISLHFFLNYAASDNITNLIDVGSYFSQVIGVSLGIGLVFQLPLLIHFLTRVGLVSPTILRKYRKHAAVGLAVVSAVITPPDLFSLVLVMLPLYGLYELSIFLSARTWKKHHAEA